MSDIKAIVRQETDKDFPRRIIIIKPSTREEVVMTFNQGRICQFLYKIPDSNIKMTYNKEQKRYLAVQNPPKIKIAYALINDELEPIGPSKNQESPNQQLFTCFSSPLWGYSIWFGGGAIQINMDSHHRLVNGEEAHLSYQGTAEVVRVYNAEEESETKTRMLNMIKRAQTLINPVRNYSRSR